MDSLKVLRDTIKRLDSGLTVKTMGDYDLFGNKLFAIYSKKERLSPFYSVKEWSLQKIMSSSPILLKLSLGQ